MEWVIHRGNDEFGGNCLELCQKGFRLLVDYGKPLPGALENPLPPSMGIDAVLISHGHADHHGYLDRLSPKVPVYLSSLTQVLMETTRIFDGSKPLENQFVTLNPEEPTRIGPFEVTAFSVDHSFPDSYAFRIRAGGKTLFYSGDLRQTGRLAPLTLRLSKKRIGPVDLLFLEGTNIARGGGLFPDEDSVESAFREGLRGASGAAFLICSGQNVERLVRAWKAAVVAKRSLVVDLYTAWVLDQVGSLSPALPRAGRHNLRVLTRGGKSAWYRNRLKSQPDYFKDFLRKIDSSGAGIREDEILQNAGRCLIKLPPGQILPLLEKMKGPSTVFYSLWKGYLQKEPESDANRVRTHPGVKWAEIHTSGHATGSHLREIARRIHPKCLVPIHTEQPHLMGDWGGEIFLAEKGMGYKINA